MAEHTLGARPQDCQAMVTQTQVYWRLQVPVCTCVPARALLRLCGDSAAHSTYIPVWMHQWVQV
jgi:hypothetical protein